MRSNPRKPGETLIEYVNRVFAEHAREEARCERECEEMLGEVRRRGAAEAAEAHADRIRARGMGVVL